MSNAEWTAFHNGPTGVHEHVWDTTVEHAWMTGNPHRRCTVDGCRVVSLDFDENDQ